MKHLTIFAFSFILAFLFGLFLYFIPFTYIDNAKSQIVCENKQVFDMGPNYIYAFDRVLDSFNDVQARKICAFGAIRDYDGVLQPPKKINYDVIFIRANSSDWFTSIFMFVLMFMSGMILFQRTKLDQKTAFIITIISSLFFLLIIKPVNNLRCLNKTAQQVMSFRNAAYRNGVFNHPALEKHISESYRILYSKCLSNKKF